MDDSFDKYISENKLRESRICIQAENDIHKVISDIRKKGYFRASRYNYEIKCLYKLYRFIIEEYDSELYEQEKQYLKSINNLWSFGKSLREYRYLISKPQKNIKEYLAIADYFFLLKQYRPPFIAIPEQISIGISTLIYTFLNNNQIELNHKLNIDNDHKFKQYINEISYVYLMEKYKEFEILVDYFGYNISLKNNELHLEGEKEKYIKVGYIYSDNASLNTFLHLYNDSSLNIMKEHDLLKQICENITIFFSITKDQLGDRITFGIPDIFAFKKMLFKVLKVDNWYPFEKLDLLLVTKELHIDTNDKFYDENHLGVGINDILRFKRMFYIFQQSLIIFLEKQYGNDWYKNQDVMKLVLQSLIPVISTEQMKFMLRFVYPKNKIDKIYNLFRWNYYDMTKIKFDLQTFPIVECGKLVFLLPNLIVHSNLVRNILSALSIRFDSGGESSPIEDALERICLSRNYKYLKSAKYKNNNTQGDIDFAFLIDDCLFIFECKNSLPPSDMFQLRTSYDYILKASKQLTKHKNNYKNYKDISTSINLKLDQPIGYVPSKIITSIIMGNRMFSGFMIDNNIVCNIYELYHFLNEGTVTIRKKIYSLWQGPQLSSKDLIDYLGENSYLRSRHKSLESTVENYEINKKKIILHTFKFDESKLEETIPSSSECNT